jgi:N4-gp56 family major capsid protein
MADTALGSPFPSGSAVTGTEQVAGGGPNSVYTSAVGYFGPTGPSNNANIGYASAPTTGTTMMGPAIQVIWSKEILFQAMPVLRFEQFAVKKTELGVMPGLTVNFMRYNNLPIPSGPLVEGVRMRTYALSAQQYQIKVAEQGFGVAVTELLLNASFDDVMASASRLLGRNMALYIDTQARTALQRSSSEVYGYTKPAVINTGYGVYEPGTAGTYTNIVTTPSGGPFFLTMHTIKDAVEVLASKNIPRMGETYVAFVHPHQSRRLRDTPEFIEVTKYASPGNFMLGEIGRLNDVVFIETTQIGAPFDKTKWPATLSDDPSVGPAYWRADTLGVASPAAPDVSIDQPASSITGPWTRPRSTPTPVPAPSPPPGGVSSGPVVVPPSRPPRPRGKASWSETTPSAMPSASPWSFATVASSTSVGSTLSHGTESGASAPSLTRRSCASSPTEHTRMQRGGRLVGRPPLA